MTLRLRTLSGITHIERGRRAHGREVCCWSIFCRAIPCPYSVTRIFKRLAPRAREILAQLKSSPVFIKVKREIVDSSVVCVIVLGEIVPSREK